MSATSRYETRHSSRRFLATRTFRHLRALGIALGFACLSIPDVAQASPSADSWWGPDKALHFGISAGLAAGGYALSSLVFERPWQRALSGVGVSLSAGIGKELFDLATHGDASFKDLAWDGLGAGVGITAALLIDGSIRPSGAEPARHQATLTLVW